MFRLYFSIYDAINHIVCDCFINRKITAVAWLGCGERGCVECESVLEWDNESRAESRSLVTSALMSAATSLRATHTTSAQEHARKVTRGPRQ